MKRASLVLLLIACDGPVPIDDAGTDAGAPSTAILEPAPPVLTPCPAGWSEVTVGGVVVCDPTPGGVADCEDGEARFPGSAACEPVGHACPAGEFADDLPSTAVLHVRPGASGDGSRASPFGTIAAALGAASAGTTIALAKGTYDESLRMRSGVTVRGACAAETILQWRTPRGEGSIVAAAGVTGAVVADLSVRRSDNIGARVAGELRLEGVVIEEAMLFGLAVLGGRVEAEGLLVRATRTFDGDQGGGAVVEGGTLIATRAVLTENHQYGLAVGAGSRAELTDVASRAQVVGARAGLAAGVVAESGGTITGTRLELSGARGVAALASGGGVIELTDALVRGTRADGAEHGFGLGSTGGVVRATRVWIDGNQGTAVSALSGAEVSLTDAVIGGTVAPPLLPGWAVGVQVADRSAGVLERVLVEGGMSAGVLVLGVEGDAPADTSLRATDLGVRDIVDEGTSGVGVYVASAGAELSRIRIERATEAAMIANAGAHLRLEHARILDTRPDPTDGQWGRGLEVVDADAEIAHARFEGQREVALIFRGGRSTLTGLEILDTRERGCAQSTCSGEPGGIGIGVYGATEVSVSDFTIDGAPLCGVQLALGAALDLSEGVITNASIGACVQVEGYDVSRLAQGVAYRETDTSIQTTAHYVPDIHDPLP